MTLLVYFILTASHTWEFMAIERVHTRAYCEVLARDVNKAFANQPGNMRIICAADLGSEA